MAAAQKKVVLRTFSGSIAWGYLPQTGFLRESDVTLMEVDGRVTYHKLKEVKTICYVRDFNLDDTVGPERLLRRTFAARPRGDGTWLRLMFRDDEVLEGLATFDLGFMDAVTEDRGITITPPDTRGNTQRVFVPRSALQFIEVLGFVTAPSKRRAAKVAKPRSEEKQDAQTRLFGEE
jgi:hypothetical protein